MDANSNDIAWCAGLFEGEGNIALQRGKYLRLWLGLTDRDVLQRYAVILEGHITGPYAADGKKLRWCWTEGRKEHVRNILGAFWMHLGERRKARAIEFGYRP